MCFLLPLFSYTQRMRLKCKLEAQGWDSYTRLTLSRKHISYHQIRHVFLSVGLRQTLCGKLSHLRLYLQKAAADGPIIVINISKFRSDAIIVQDVSEPVIIPLLATLQALPLTLGP